MKRLSDIVVSLLILILSSPLFVFLAIAIKLETRGPIIFRQDRVGLDGRLFPIYKFRSMHVNLNDPGSYQTSAGDSRITRVGRFMRNSSLDELPQLLNVLRGEMSIVGPRPDLMIQKHGYSAEDWVTRNTVRPGITGLAQINGRSNINSEDRLYYDLKYARTNNFLLDVKILFRTLAMVFLRKNIN